MIDEFIAGMAQTKPRCDFRASATLKLHEKAVDVLEMIVDCDKRIYNSRCELNTGSDNVWNDFKVWHQRRIKKYEAIKQRLTAYYIDIMSRIQDLAIKHLNAA